MESSQPKTGGVVEALKRAGDSALALLQNRLQLFVVELQEEKYRLLQSMLWLALGAMLIFLGLTVGLGALIVWVWDTLGWLGLIGICVLMLIAGALVVSTTWKRMKSAGTPFSGTVAELRKDREWLQRKR
jgi:uncharacterized membrane protein YqjE